MFTPETLSVTAKARTAPTAARKMPTPRPILPSPFVVLVTSLGVVHRLNDEVPRTDTGRSARRLGFRLGSARDAQGPDFCLARDWSPRRGNSYGRRTAAPMAAGPGVEGARPHRLRDLV